MIQLIVINSISIKGGSKMDWVGIVVGAVMILAIGWSFLKMPDILKEWTDKDKDKEE